MIFTTWTPKGMRIGLGGEVDDVLALADARRGRCWAETSPGPRRWMMPGEARSRTSTAFMGSPVSSRSRGEVLQLHGHA